MNDDMRWLLAFVQTHTCEALAKWGLSVGHCVEVHLLLGKCGADRRAAEPELFQYDLLAERWRSGTGPQWTGDSFCFFLFRVGGQAYIDAWITVLKNWERQLRAAGCDVERAIRVLARVRPGLRSVRSWSAWDRFLASLHDALDSDPMSNES